MSMLTSQSHRYLIRHRLRLRVVRKLSQCQSHLLGQQRRLGSCGNKVKGSQKGNIQ